MSVTITQFDRNVLGETQVKFSSDAEIPVIFRIYVDGEQVEIVESNDGTGQWRGYIPQGDSVFLEIRDDRCIPQLAFPARFTLNWLGVEGAVEYVIKKFMGVSYDEQERIRDNGDRAYSWLSDPLEDGASHIFQIVPVDAGGNEGTELEFAKLMVRHPDAPALTETTNFCELSQCPTITNGLSKNGMITCNGEPSWISELRALKPAVLILILPQEIPIRCPSILIPQHQQHMCSRSYPMCGLTLASGPLQSFKPAPRLLASKLRWPRTPRSQLPPVE